MKKISRNLIIVSLSLSMVMLAHNSLDKKAKKETINQGESVLIASNQLDQNRVIRDRREFINKPTRSRAIATARIREDFKTEEIEENNHDEPNLIPEDISEVIDVESEFYLDVAMNDLDFERYALHDIPMPIEHQRYLYNLCQERGLDYIETLAILKHESQFQANLTHKNKNGTIDYGYMQVNSVSHDKFASLLGTPKTPLDPYVNLNWGTHELSTLRDGYAHQGQTGRELFESMQSAYNKGVYGYKKHGKAVRYIQRTDKELAWIKAKLGL